MNPLRPSRVLDSLVLPGNARIVALAGVFLTGGTALWWPLFAIFLFSLGFNVVAIGVVFALGTATSIVAAPIGGILADRYSRKGVIVAAGAMNAVGTLSFALSCISSVAVFPVVAAFFCLASFGGNMAVGAVRALLFESAPQNRKGAAMSSSYVLPSFAAIPMPFLGSVLSQTAGWPVVFVLAGSLVALATLTFALLLKEARTEPPPLKSNVKRRGTWLSRAALLSPVGALLGVYAIVGLGQGITGPFMALYFTTFLGSTVQFFGILTSIEMATVGILALLSGKLVDRLGALSTVTLSLGGEACIVGVMVFVRNIVFAGGLYETWGALDWFDLTAPSVFIGSHVERQNRATAIASFGVATRLPGLVAPEIGGLLFVAYAPSILMVYAAIITVSAFLVMALGRRETHSAPADPTLQSRTSRM